LSQDNPIGINGFLDPQSLTGRSIYNRDSIFCPLTSHAKIKLIGVSLEGFFREMFEGSLFAFVVLCAEDIVYELLEKPQCVREWGRGRSQWGRRGMAMRIEGMVPILGKRN